MLIAMLFAFKMPVNSSLVTLYGDDPNAACQSGASSRAFQPKVA
jgi:hypothetical protein